jgi:hypothetical protein
MCTLLLLVEPSLKLRVCSFGYPTPFRSGSRQEKGVASCHTLQCIVMPSCPAAYVWVIPVPVTLLGLQSGVLLFFHPAWSHQTLYW